MGDPFVLKNKSSDLVNPVILAEIEPFSLVFPPLIFSKLLCTVFSESTFIFCTLI